MNQSSVLPAFAPSIDPEPGRATVTIPLSSTVSTSFRVFKGSPNARITVTHHGATYPTLLMYDAEDMEVRCNRQRLFFTHPTPNTAALEANYIAAGMIVSYPYHRPPLETRQFLDVTLPPTIIYPEIEQRIRPIKSELIYIYFTLATMPHVAVGALYRAGTLISAGLAYAARSEGIPHLSLAFENMTDATPRVAVTGYNVRSVNDPTDNAFVTGVHRLADYTLHSDRAEFRLGVPRAGTWGMVSYPPIPVATTFD